MSARITSSSSGSYRKSPPRGRIIACTGKRVERRVTDALPMEGVRPPSTSASQSSSLVAPPASASSADATESMHTSSAATDVDRPSSSAMIGTTFVFHPFFFGLQGRMRGCVTDGPTGDRWRWPHAPQPRPIEYIAASRQPQAPRHVQFDSMRHTSERPPPPGTG
eukprot:scaffold6743_cov118-Isochrysis_galbana.AAC.3